MVEQIFVCPIAEVAESLGTDERNLPFELRQNLIEQCIAEGPEDCCDCVFLAMNGGLGADHEG